MKCPHCGIAFHWKFGSGQEVSRTDTRRWDAYSAVCPACDEPTIWVVPRGWDSEIWPNDSHRVYPRVATPFVPREVPKEFAQDYREACLVLPDSPKASAALSRRCLQHLLREKANVSAKDLAPAIDQVLNQQVLPTHLAEALHAVRNIGNFAAHPIKSTASGEIVEVEAGEAEWNLEVLEGLFDFYFVAPEKFQQRADALNKKLQVVGKPPLKTGPQPGAHEE